MRKTAFILILFLCAALLPFPVSADGETLQYTDEKTGFRAVVQDEYDLLTDEEEQKLLKDVIPLTAYTNVAFWSTAKASTESAAEWNAEEKHIELFGSGTNGIVFMIDMELRYDYLETWGWIQEHISDSTAEIITNNVRSDMQARRYYSAAASVYKQVYGKVMGQKIAEPMRYLSAISIGIMCGLLFALALTLKKRKALITAYSLSAVAATVLLLPNRDKKLTNFTTVGRPVVVEKFRPQASLSDLSDSDRSSHSSSRSSSSSSRSSSSSSRSSSSSSRSYSSHSSSHSSSSHSGSRGGGSRF